MDKYCDLKNKYIAVGSLPFDDLNEAMEFIANYSSDIPFCPQLRNYSRNEDMLFQYLEGMPEVYVNNGKIFINLNIEDGLKSITEDFNAVLTNISSSVLKKYAITKSHCVAFKEFLNYINDKKPKYAKVQIIGPFSLSVNIFDKDDRKACFNRNSIDLIKKSLILKVLWQINEIKKVSPETVPVVFIDEPSIYQLDKAEYLSLKKSDIIFDIRFMSDLIKEHGALSGVHCCGDCNWADLLDLDLNFIHFDAFTYGDKFNCYASEVDRFLKNGGKIAWGVVPTLNLFALKTVNVTELDEILENDINLLVKKGVDKNLIKDNLLISSSCGCATLSVKLTKKTFKLAYDLSKKLKG